MKKVIFGLMATVLFSTSAFAGSETSVALVEKRDCGSYADGVADGVSDVIAAFSFGNAELTPTQWSEVWVDAYAKCTEGGNY